MSQPKNGNIPTNKGSRRIDACNAGIKCNTSVNSGVRNKQDNSLCSDDQIKHAVKLDIDSHTHVQDKDSAKHTHGGSLELASFHTKSLDDRTSDRAKHLRTVRAHSEGKPQRRALVKQSTQGRFELKEHFPTSSGESNKSPAIISTDLSDKVKSGVKETIVVGDSDVSSRDKKGDIKFVDLSKFQRSTHFPDLGLNSRAIPEEIPLREINQRLGHSAVDVSDYRQKFNERIRLKEKSRSVDNPDSYLSTQLVVGESVIDRLRNAGNKVLAVCSVHVSANTDGKNSVHLSPEATSKRELNAKTAKDQKHFLSPDTHPSMLEKSKSLHRILNPSQIATEVKRLVHQTSAERKRLANQSSTETSGLGETVTSGFSSQESVHSYNSGARVGNTEQSLPDQGIDLCEDTRNIRHEGNSTFGTRIIDSDNTINHTNEPKKGNGCMYSADDVDTSGVDRPVANTNSQSSAPLGTCRKTSEKKVSGEKEMVNRQMTGRNIIGQSHLSSAYKPPLDFRSNDVRRPVNIPMFSANVGPDFDVLFTQSKNLKVPASTVGLQLDQINSEWDKHKRSSSVKSRSSQGSFRSRSGSTRRSRRYLSHKESKWMKWGRERRMSLRKRIENLDKPEPEVPPRASTPVKKARQEGLMFVHPDLGSKYISEDDINYIRRHKQERLKTCKLIEKSKLKLHYEAHDINRLTPDELMTLARFWEHRVFVRTRYVSILLSLVTTVIYVLSICSTQWVTYPSPEVMDHYAHEGLWFRCHPVQTNNRYTESCDDPARRVDEHNFEGSLWENICMNINSTIRPMACRESITNWQNAVIGLMIFSAAFGFVAAILAICGVCTSPLPKKIYYFHSAGEIFFVCALTTTVALIIYAIAISTDASIRSHTYGSGYGLGWGGTAFFFAASFCMSLDELVRESAQNRCCRYLCWRSRSSDRDNSQHV